MLLAPSPPAFPSRSLARAPPARSGDPKKGAAGTFRACSPTEGKPWCSPKGPCSGSHGLFFFPPSSGSPIPPFRQACPFLFFISGKPWTRGKVGVAISKARAGGGGDQTAACGAKKGDGGTFLGSLHGVFLPSARSGRGGSACAARDLFLKLWKLACFARGWSAGILAEIQQSSGKEPVPLLVVFPGLSSSPCTPVAAGGGFSSSPLGFFSFSFCRSAGRRAAVACSSPSAG